MDTTEKIILIILIAGIIFILYIALKIIKRILRFIFSIFNPKWQHKDPTKSEDWLIKAQARQEIRFQNSMPPTRHESKPQKFTLKEKTRMRKGKSPSGWVYNEETHKWDPPKNLH